MTSALFPMLRVRRDADRALVPPRKENAPCCRSKRDELGRYRIGYCSRGCMRRPANWRRFLSHGCPHERRQRLSGSLSGVDVQLCADCWTLATLSGLLVRRTS